MTIIPYIKSGCLDSTRHFNTIRNAVEWAFDDMYAQPDNTDTIQKRFRIIDTEEDFTVSFSKKDGDIIAPIGWFELCGTNNLRRTGVAMFEEYICGITGLSCCGCSVCCEHRKDK